MGIRRKSREMALQFLFGHDFREVGNDPDVISAEFERYCGCFKTADKSLDYARQLITGVRISLAEIDALIRKHSHHWRLERMSLIDRNILRIAIYEMKFVADVPTRVAINEALEIAKQYSIPESISFINGILDAVETESAA